MTRTAIAIALALAVSSGSALAAGGGGGGVPGALYESSQPHPRFSQAEMAAAFDPVEWFRHLIGSSDRQVATATAPRAPVTAGTADGARG